MNRVLLIDLVKPSSGSDRIFLLSVWFKGHNNPRHAQLLPRLSRVDCYLIHCSSRRIVRAVQFRLLMKTKRIWMTVLLKLAARKYDYMLVLDPEQVPRFAGKCLVDLDDPTFSEREIQFLSQPNLAAYIVTTPQAGQELESAGVSAPWHVIEQGIDLSSFDPREAERFRQFNRFDDEVIVGYVAAFLATDADPSGDEPLYNVEHLLDLWDRIRSQLPSARLWLIGNASKHLQLRCRDREDLVLFGSVSQKEALVAIANFDIALYPRNFPHSRNRMAVKVAEYMAMGVPTVAYDLNVTRVLDRTRGGVLVASSDEFVGSVIDLATDRERRQRLGENARAAASAWDWENLARRYERVVLDRYFPLSRSSS